MALKDEFTSEECFKVEDGTPTLTVQQENHHWMIPWMHFRHAIWQEEIISLHFQGWLVVIQGQNLNELWEAFQLQRVRCINLSMTGQGRGCVVQELDVRPA